MAELTRPAPFVARWQLTPAGAGTFDARLTLDDPAPFAGHYPGTPLLPGAFQIEAILQAAASALGSEWRLAQISSCRFHGALLPGDLLQAHLTIADADDGAKIVEATLKGRAEAAEMRLRLAPTTAALDDGPEAAREVRPGLTWEQSREGARVLDPTFLLRTLPHRHPALLVDGALLACADTPKPVLMSRKAVTLGERCYASPEALSSFAYPASLIAESFSQSCGLLRAGSAPPGERRDETRVPVIAKLAKMRFWSEALPGEVLEHRIRLAARMPDGAVFSGETVVGDRLIMQVERVVAATAQRL